MVKIDTVENIEAYIEEIANIANTIFPNWKSYVYKRCLERKSKCRAGTNSAKKDKKKISSAKALRLRGKAAVPYPVAFHLHHFPCFIFFYNLERHRIKDFIFL